MVPGVGIEPTLPCGNEILNLARLPVSPPGQVGAGRESLQGAQYMRFVGTGNPPGALWPENCGILRPFVAPAHHSVQMTSKFAQPLDAGQLARAQRGEPAALELLYRQFGGPVLGLARRLLRRNELAEEVVQDTFLDVMRKIHGFRGEAPVGMWIRQIAVNRCLMLLRSYWEQHRDALPDHDTPAAGQERMHGTWNDDLSRLDIDALLEQLPPDTRTVLWLHEVEGYTHEEIGRLMGKTTSYSKSRLARGHARLRELVAAPIVEDSAP